MAAIDECLGHRVEVLLNQQILGSVVERFRLGTATLCLGGSLLEGLLQPPALAHVADGADDDGLALPDGPRGADLDREDGAVALPVAAEMWHLKRR